MNIFKKIGYFVPLTLGFLTAFGPFVTDFYLPAMPEMAKDFATSPALVSMSLTCGIIGLAAGQIMIGPISDKYGRKRPLIISMLIFCIASVLCLFTNNIHVFNALRIIQGFGGAGGIVLSKSISTDLFTGKELQSFMAILGAINGIAPVCAPIVGGVVASFTNWQGIFCLLLVIGVILLICSMLLKETLVKGHRSDKNIIRVYSNLFTVFKNGRFTLSTLSTMFCFFTFFAYIASSPFILQNLYELTPLEFSLCFGANAFMIGVGSGLCTLFKHQNTALKYASMNFMTACVCIALCLCFKAPLTLLMGSYIYMMLGFGLLQPSVTAIALDSERKNAGAASAVFGASNFVAGAISSPLVVLGNIQISASIIIVIGGLGCLLLALPLCEKIKEEGIESLHE